MLQEDSDPEAGSQQEHMLVGGMLYNGVGRSPSRPGGRRARSTRCSFAPCEHFGVDGSRARLARWKRQATRVEELDSPALAVCDGLLDS